MSINKKFLDAMYSRLHECEQAIDSNKATKDFNSERSADIHRARLTALENTKAVINGSIADYIKIHSETP